MTDRYRVKKPGTDAERPTLAGGRGPAGARGGGGGGASWRGGAPKLKKFPPGGVLD